MQCPCSPRLCPHSCWASPDMPVVVLVSTCRGLCRWCAVRNGVETGVDCGNSAASGCGACAVGQPCGGNGDCSSTRCASGVCALLASCHDGVVNGGESDVDCGGSSTCVRCDVGGACSAGSDCASASCDDASGVCLAARSVWVWEVGICSLDHSRERMPHRRS